METRRWAQDGGPNERDWNPEKALGRVGRRWSCIGPPHVLEIKPEVFNTVPKH